MGNKQSKHHRHHHRVWHFMWSSAAPAQSHNKKVSKPSHQAQKPRVPKHANESNRLQRSPQHVKAVLQKCSLGDWENSFACCSLENLFLFRCSLESIDTPPGPMVQTKTVFNSFVRFCCYLEIVEQLVQGTTGGRNVITGFRSFSSYI